MYGPSTSSGKLTVSIQITARSAILHTAILAPPTTGIALLTIYDSANNSVSGKTVLKEIEILAGNSTDSVMLSSPVVANAGIYCVFSGTGSSYIVHFNIT